MQLGMYSKHLEILNDSLCNVPCSTLNLINTAFHILALKPGEKSENFSKRSGENSFFSTVLVVSATIQENNIYQA